MYNEYLNKRNIAYAKGYPKHTFRLKFEIPYANLKRNQICFMMIKKEKSVVLKGSNKPNPRGILTIAG